jgi:hypothetical protein
MELPGAPVTDFIDVLEQQLVAAHGRPERRRCVAVFLGADRVR